MAVYIPYNSEIKVVLNEMSRNNDQVVLSGSNPTYDVEKGVFYIENIQVAAGSTIDIKDGKNVNIVTGITSIDFFKSPLRCDYGIKVVGAVLLLKGFFLRNVFTA